MPLYDPFLAARQRMVECQLLPSGIRDDGILSAMQMVPRELFVPENLKGAAYVDEDVPLGRMRYLMAPLVLARILEIASIQPGDKVLEIGCASGYATAVIARLAKQVVAVEEQMELAEQARQLLNRQKAKNAEVITGPMAPGYPSAGPYHVILVGGAVGQVPASLPEQLAEGGRMVVIEKVAGRSGSQAGLGRVRLYTKQGGRLLSRECFDVAVPVLQGFEMKTGFVF